MVDFNLIIDIAPQIDKTAGTLALNPALIKIGCDMKQLTHLMLTSDEIRPFFKRFKSAFELYSKHTANMIGHEVLHLIILELEGWQTAHAFDWIDDEYQISGYNDCV